MKKNDLFIDVSSHNGYDITGILADRIPLSKFLKVQAISILACPLKLSNLPLLDFIISHGLAATSKKPNKRHATSLIMCLKK